MASHEFWYYGTEFHCEFGSLWNSCNKVAYLPNSKIAHASFAMVLRPGTLR
jgi:hypothetical protein